MSDTCHLMSGLHMALWNHANITTFTPWGSWGAGKFASTSTDLLLFLCQYAGATLQSAALSQISPTLSEILGHRLGSAVLRINFLSHQTSLSQGLAPCGLVWWQCFCYTHERITGLQVKSAYLVDIWIQLDNLTGDVWGQHVYKRATYIFILSKELYMQVIILRVCG